MRRVIARFASVHTNRKYATSNLRVIYCLQRSRRVGLNSVFAIAALRATCYVASNVAEFTIVRFFMPSAANVATSAALALKASREQEHHWCVCRHGERRSGGGEAE